MTPNVRVNTNINLILNINVNSILNVNAGVNFTLNTWDFTPPAFQAIDFTPLISLNFNSFSDKNTKKWVFLEKFTPLAKKFTLPAAVTAVTNLTSARSLTKQIAPLCLFNSTQEKSTPFIIDKSNLHNKIRLYRCACALLLSPPFNKEALLLFWN